MTSFESGISILVFLDGARNDINILNLSPLFQKIRAGALPEITQFVNMEEFQLRWYYFPTDQIYSKYKNFVQTYLAPRSKTKKAFGEGSGRCEKGYRNSFSQICLRGSLF